jgi:hypothetical protein
VAIPGNPLILAVEDPESARMMYLISALESRARVDRVPLTNLTSAREASKLAGSILNEDYHCVALELPSSSFSSELRSSEEPYGSREVSGEALRAGTAQALE